jgi:hypothetical protein
LTIAEVDEVAAGEQCSKGEGADDFAAAVHRVDGGCVESPMHGPSCARRRSSLRP